GLIFFVYFSSRRRHTRFSRDWSSDVCSSDLPSIIKDIERVIRLLAARGDMGILLVEQYYDFAQALADHYAVMARGELRRQGAGEIGRASCRERVKNVVVAGAKRYNNVIFVNK